MDERNTPPATAAAIAKLPNRTLTGGAPVQEAFLKYGIASFRDACTWVQQLEYGDTVSGCAPAALLAERRGTCTTKHGAIASLAAEIGLDLHQLLGFYRMDDAMVPGVGELLEPLGLPFVPMVHCFLLYGDVHLDLTAGNRDGRERPVDRYDFVVPVAAGSTRQEYDRLYVEQLPRYYALEPRLSAVPLATVVALAARCRQLAHARAGQLQSQG